MMLVVVSSAMKGRAPLQLENIASLTVTFIGTCPAKDKPNFGHLLRDREECFLRSEAVNLDEIDAKPLEVANDFRSLDCIPHSSADIAQWFSWISFSRLGSVSQMRRTLYRYSTRFAAWATDSERNPNFF